MFFREGERLLAIDKDGAVGFDGDSAAAGANQILEGAESNGRNIEAHVLMRLRNFDERKSAARTQLTGARYQCIGTFDGFDAEHGLIADGDTLADVESSHVPGNLPTEFDV